uniref:Lipocalin/cytosolic fatty-acid binding domain-containing protein n=1 Tax=Monodelphis domestica TaxID=13616 RepID=A0A5F8HAN7_MONDO
MGSQDSSLTPPLPSLPSSFPHHLPNSPSVESTLKKRMAVSPLWIGLSLLGVLQTQAETTPEIPAPDLSRVPLQDNFQQNQFQGKWYVVGVAGNAFTSEEQGRFKMYTTAYDLQKDNSYIVTSTILRDNLCDRFVRTFVQKDRPGQFTLGNLKSEHGFLWVRLGLLQCAGPKDRPIKMGGRVMRYPTSKQGEGCYFWHHLQGPASTLSFLPPGYGLQDYFIRVVKTDYNNYAVVYFKKTVNNVDYFKITLYGRRDNLQPELKKDFTNFVKSLGLTDENIVFPVKINKCIYEA